MRIKFAVLGAVAAVYAGGCSGQVPSSEGQATSSSAIQGGTNDSTHSFAVGVVVQRGGGVALCSGALLAPNLVATARHCVAPLSATAIDCATTTFGAVTAATNVTVTTDATISALSTRFAVSKIIVPAGANQVSVCGNDLAILIVSQTIPLPQYVTPVISPPMTDHSAYSTTATDIGYGISTPTDTTGTTAGVRRIRQDVNLVCIPNDTGFTNCFPAGTRLLTASEFLSGNATCDGDSGSSAFEQRNFTAGNWVSFGVLSRGSVDRDGGTCIEGVYTRFDAWGPLLIDAANQAATMGGYSPPGWATGGDGGGSKTTSPPEGGMSAAIEAGASPGIEAGASAGEAGASSGVEGGSCSNNGALCGTNGDCCSVNCLSHDQGKTFVCSTCDTVNDFCDTGYACQQGICVPTPAGGGSNADASAGGGDHAQPATTATGKGCSCALTGAGPPSPDPWQAGLTAIGLAGFARLRRRRARSPTFRGSDPGR